ncbi:1-acyl-sn-glycerol-3-phosphate acyltransferase epsilon [Paramuricea clavata]|uniref:Coactosin-like protein n=1 Tax=Paramuricea clavata TaxID=317549 RepID=A0A6S7HE15_PARCT|nr:1-acyl-sn-glycerol-3-phosphate acyltransferase epsilon [Paramuricea clavata]
MMNTILQQAVSFRSTVPILLTLSVAPQYLFAWSLWRAVSSILPRKVYEYVDDKLYDTYQTMVVFFFENYAGTELIFYGDEIPLDKKENVLYLCNHQSTVDWAVVDMIAIRQGSMGSIRYILKDSLKYLPLFGFYFPQHGCIYVRRNASSDVVNIERRMKKFEEDKTSMWLVIFPEGTRYDADKPEQIKQSQEFAKSRGLIPLNHVLTPRTKATEIALETLSDHFDAVYDLTIAYKEKYENIVPRKRPKDLLEFFDCQDPEIHVHVRRLTPDQIPQGCEEKKQWIYDAFSLKERMLSQFFSEDSEVQGRFPGPSRRHRVPLARTLSWTMFWAGVLAPFLATNVEFENEDDFKNAISECRSDNFETNWVLARHVDQNPNLVTLSGFGNGGAEELKESLEDDSVMYGLVRFQEQIDQSSTVKFVYIHWIGKQVPFTMKGRYGIVRGSVNKSFQPHHVSVETDNVSDLDHEALLNVINENSGTKNKVLDAEQASERKAYDRGFTGRETGNNKKRVTGGFTGFQGKSGASVKFDDSVHDAASDLRSDTTETNWFVAGYQDGNPKLPLICLGSGSEGVGGITEILTNDIVGYALCRVTDVVDDISTVKFVYIQWVGDNVKPLVKAKTSTHKADLEQIFHPAHATIFANSQDEISESEIMDKVQSSSGSKSHVRNNTD